MKPHDEITLDFDWFYRVVLNKLVLWISKLCDGIFAWCDRHASKTAEYLRTHFGDPYLWTQGSSSVKIRKFSFENESRLIGDVMTVIVLVLTIMLALVTYLAA
jgi:multicomponent Na+:H+ antiporter subunit D